MDSAAGKTPPGWLEILAESEVELVAGQLVPTEEVHRALRESIARLEAKAAKPQRKAADRR